jgi:hypothetical protein
VLLDVFDPLEREFQALRVSLRVALVERACEVARLAFSVVRSPILFFNRLQAPPLPGLVIASITNK